MERHGSGGDQGYGDLEEPAPRAPSPDQGADGGKTGAVGAAGGGVGGRGSGSPAAFSVQQGGGGLVYGRRSSERASLTPGSGGPAAGAAGTSSGTPGWIAELLGSPSPTNGSGVAHSYANRRVGGKIRFKAPSFARDRRYRHFPDND